MLTGLLHRIARRCPTYHRASQPAIRRLETELGIPPSPAHGDLVDQLADPRIIDCGHRWCPERRRTYRYPEVGGHASADITMHELPPPPEWMIKRRWT